MNNEINILLIIRMTTQCLFISLGQWSLAKKPSIFSHLICYFGKNTQPLGPLPFVNIFLELFTGGLPPPAFRGCHGSWYGHFGLEKLFSSKYWTEETFRENQTDIVEMKNIKLGGRHGATSAGSGVSSSSKGGSSSNRNPVKQDTIA